MGDYLWYNNPRQIKQRRINMSAQRLDVSQQFKESAIKMIAKIIKDKTLSRTVRDNDHDIVEYKIIGTDISVTFHQHDVHDKPKACTVYMKDGYIELYGDQSKSLYEIIHKRDMETRKNSRNEYEESLLEYMSQYITPEK